MGITVSWDNGDKTIIRVEFGDDCWALEDFSDPAHLLCFHMSRRPCPHRQPGGHGKGSYRCLTR